MNDVEVEKVDWLEPWSPVVDPKHAATLERELKKEVTRGHALFGQNARAIAVRSDQDDVLFAIGNPIRLVVVHLTWLSGADRPPWPRTTFFESASEFVEKQMKADHSAFT